MAGDYLLRGLAEADTAGTFCPQRESLDLLSGA